MKSVCIFCSSSPAVEEHYFALARQVGVACAGRGVRVVYGGGRSGLMGAMAEAALDEGAEVVGVIPQFLKDREIAHTGLSQLHIVQTMHERQAMMMDLAGGFVVLPGGLGTLAELTEVLTWKQLRLGGMEEKPVALFNQGGFWNRMLDLFAEMQDGRFLYGSPEDLPLPLENIQDFERFITDSENI